MDTLNHLPAYVLQSLNSPRAIVYCSEDTQGAVKVTTTLKPENLSDLPGLEVLEQARQQGDVYSITLSLLKLTPELAQEAAVGFTYPEQILRELLDLLQRHVEVYVAYVVTHYNRKPLDELTVYIGGDCYRRDQPSFSAILERTQLLSKAMLRKAVMIFPDIPALHGGKKGEWIVLNRNGMEIGNVSDDAIVALGTVILPMGIFFSNRLKEQSAQVRGIFANFPACNYIRPDTVSPDVLSGQYWPLMCEVWARRGLDLSHFTCLPSGLGGPQHPSSHPTGFGIATTAVQLAQARFPNRPLHELHFLMEALGGVGLSTLEALIEGFGVPAQNVTAFDLSSPACHYAHQCYPLAKVEEATHEAYYLNLLGNAHVDVWINNGLGNNTTPKYVDALLAHGVRLLCGAANDILEVGTLDKSLKLIFKAGAWIWPDTSASGGGWTLAVVDLFKRCQGQRSNDPETGELILNTIASRNQDLVKTVLDRVGHANATGQAIWDCISQLTEGRVAKARSQSPALSELAQLADVRTWAIS
ncbi:MAG: hypothetical protein HY872_02555 [Chloroflexi bacterium]|nr:hypothetical protein [Chloroflexota bacterium]